MNIAIIPARGGSKRIPNKNIKVFLGKPILSYSIRAAKETGLFDHVIVSTDSEKIAEIARVYGAEVPFIRPKELADDFTHTAPVVVHALNWFKAQSMPVKYTCCIYATAPFLRPEYIRNGYEILRSNNVSSVFSVTTFPFSIFRALKITENSHLEMFWPEYENTRSNDLPEAYHDAGQFYWLDCERFLRDHRMYGNDALPVILPRYLVQDIDTPEDWEMAEHMFKVLELANGFNGKHKRVR